MRSRQRRFAQVDVFSTTPYLGNPVAVVLDGDDIDDDAMQRFARWTNLSETTFVLPPTVPKADYRLRIFTPGGELPFAGHPTLGSAHAWLEHGGTPRTEGRVMQECQAGLIELRRSAATLSFAAPPVVRSGALDEQYAGQLAQALGVDRNQIVDHQWVDNGPGWAAVLLASSREVLALEPDFADVPHAMVGVVGAHPASSPHAFEIRVFAPGTGVAEDPVTGSFNASAAQWLIAKGTAPQSYTASQGNRVGRAGVVSVTSDAAGVVWVGGASTTCIDGTVLI